MIPTIISVDLTKPVREQFDVVHNRWHPDIPPAASVKPGEAFRVECFDSRGILTSCTLN